MFILIGTSSSGKTFFIKKHIQKHNKNNIKTNSTKDIKPYIFRNSYIVDTPDINKYKDISYLINICNKIINNDISIDYYIIYFVHKYENISLSIKNWIFLKNNYKNFILFDIFKVLDIKNLNIEIINQYDQLIKFITEKTNNNQSNKNDKSVIILGITNVGKTSIINDLINYEVFRIDNNKNTTQELTFSIYKFNNQSIKIYDTCGLENNTKSKILGISNLLKYVNRSIIVMDHNTYYQKAYQYIFNFLNKNLINITFMINKIDLITDEKKELILEFLKSKYKINHKDVFFNKTIGNTNTKSNFDKILNINKIKLNHHNLNKKVKKYFSNILYVNENNQENNIYEIDVYMKRKLDIGLNISSMIKKLRNLIYKFINNKNFAIKFNIIRSSNKNKYIESEFKSQDNRVTKNIKNK